MSRRISHRDIVYATVEDSELTLDIHMPDGTTEPPLLVWVHGGAWNHGSKAAAPMAFVEHGIATASVDFRPSTSARFPAQVHDIKAAVRFLRAHAARFGYRSGKLVIAGDSSGAHLAALVGLTAGHAALEGRVGDCLDQSSAVQAILMYYGATNLATIVAQSTPFGVGIRTPALQRLLGALPGQVAQLAALASPVTHVDRTSPPLRMLHGALDPQMPLQQSLELQAAYQRAGLDVQLDVIADAAHGGAIFFAPAHLEPVLAFIERHLG
jgi:acetyl esterase/lipase